MTNPKTHNGEMLNAYFLPETFVVELGEKQADGPLKIWFEAFEADKYAALYHLGFLVKEVWFSPAVEYLHKISTLLIKKMSQKPEIEFTRENVQVNLLEDELYQLREELPFVIGMEFVDEAWLCKQWEALLAKFQAEIKHFDGTVSRYFAEYNSNINVVGRVFFHLVENQDEHYPFAFMATYTTKEVKSKKAVHTPLKNALAEFDGDEKMLLSLIATVVKAAEKSNFLADLLESGELFSALKLTSNEAYTILSEMSLYEEAGIMCRVPDWWRRKNNAIRLQLTVGEKQPARMGLTALLDFSPTLSVGDEIVSEEELRALLNMAEGLTQFKGKWVEINRDKLTAVLAAFDKAKEYAQQTGLSLREAMRMELNMHELLEIPPDALDVSTSNGQWLRNLKEHLLHPDKIREIDLEPTFKATLRAYQDSGYRWLYQMSQYGLGACLADDMGLGKTVQMLAFLEHQRIHQGGAVLLILPASLIGNWQKEIEKFAPEMSYQILHKSELKNAKAIQIKEQVFLSITTYGMAMRLEALRERTWDCVILDEAQAIKNPGAKQSKAIKAIPAKMRLAMTGTPIENKLSDLWSLFDFLNQGLLGTSTEFTGFSKGLIDHANGYAKLRKMIQPFLLRRLKTDKSIIADLPDKLEMNAYTSLSKKQVLLYQQLLKQMTEQLDDVTGITRKGLILSGILKFKQICNHPDQYLSREDFKPEDSGKFAQLKEICETIYAKRERVIVFTQFREMTGPLAEYLSTIFEQEGFVLHGGTPVKQRSEMVRQFNAEHYVPYMVLSLKAGGVGLNLTGANHVIHFDRWWNPAVENQATDRAFRIGQTKNVMVHKFVTQGTIEEKIDAIIEEKKNLSGDILSTEGEHWLTEYSNAELLNLLALGGAL